MKLKKYNAQPHQWFAAHPFSEDYPLVDGPPIWEMARHMKGQGFLKENPIVLLRDDHGTLKVLDGRRRQMACKRNQGEPNCEPVFVEFVGSEAEAVAYCQAMNLHRRHLGEADREKATRETAGRLERIARVAQARADGQSTRKIAESEGVSQTQVNRDLEAAKSSGEPGDGSPEPKTVKGKDGKSYSTSRRTSGNRGKSGKNKQGRPVFSLATALQYLSQFEAELNKLAHAAGHERKAKQEHLASAVIITPEHQEILDALAVVRLGLESWYAGLKETAA